MADVHFKGPNILITGTPGTGKTTLARELSQATGYKHIGISELAKEISALDNYDEELQTWELDEDKVIDEIDDDMREGGHIIEYHSSEFFPERWFDAVFVLRTDNSLLYSRLEKRNYPERKIQENVQCEIFQTILDEAKESYKPEIVFELQSNTPDDMEKNMQIILDWIKKWKSENNFSNN